jgi:hypothetical protein
MSETKPCIYCDAGVEADVWEEEGRMCIECSNKFYSHVINPYDPSTFPKNIKLKVKCDCRRCFYEAEARCPSCSEACLNCQDCEACDGSGETSPGVACEKCKGGGGKP